MGTVGTKVFPQGSQVGTALFRVCGDPLGTAATSLMAPSFLQEITECCRAIQTEAVALNPGLGPLLVLPLHPGVGRAAQKVYEAPEESGWERRVVVTHWLGDSSFSLGSVGFVIDTGLELRSVSGDGELGSALRQAESVGRGSGLEIICSSYCLPGTQPRPRSAPSGMGELWRRQGLTCGPFLWAHPAGLQPPDPCRVPGAAAHQQEPGRVTHAASGWQPPR